VLSCGDGGGGGGWKAKLLSTVSHSFGSVHRDKGGSVSSGCNDNNVLVVVSGGKVERNVRESLGLTSDTKDGGEIAYWSQ